MKPFRLGLVGAGRMGRTHLRALASSEAVRVVAIADPSEAARASVAAPGVSTHANVDAMISAGGLDGVLIAAPSKLHIETVRMLAAAGLPVLCEKPCGVTAADAREAAAVASKHGIPLQIAYWRRYVPSLRRLRERIATGEIGELYFVTCYQWDERPPDAVFRAGSGGIFIDMGVHEFDQLRWLTGQEFLQIRVSASQAISVPAVTGDVESAQVLCDLSGGTAGLVSLGRRFPLGDVCRAEVFGTKGSEDCRFLWPPDGEAAFMQALRLQAEGFVDRVRGRDADGATAADAIAALEAAENASRALGNQ
jgi:myo-inositol 2-dehydrogenase/D-chiro-inositol 1-dehydrogenase